MEWPGIVRAITVGTLTYFVLQLSLRTSGKRKLAKLNAFDLVAPLLSGPPCPQFSCRNQSLWRKVRRPWRATGP